MTVLFSPDVRRYFRELEDVLYEKKYFGFEDSAIRYVRKLIYEIERDLHLSVKREAPPYFERYGKNMFYSVFRKNKNTQWYVFFNIYADSGKYIYLVRYISNNHIIAQHMR